MLNSLRCHGPVIVQTLRMHLMSLMEDRLFFVSVMFGSVASILFNVVFFRAVYGSVDTLAGWTLAEAYVLLGTWHLIELVAWMTYTRGLNRTAYWVALGEFDGFLTMPLDLKTYLSYRFMNVTFSLPALVTAVLLLGYGIQQSGGAVNMPGYLALLLCGLAINYSLRVIVAAVSITNPVESPFYLTSELMRLGQYPLQIYRGLARQAVTFLVPVGLMASVPARVLFGRATAGEVATLVVVAVVFFVFSDRLYRLQLRRYDSSHG